MSTKRNTNTNSNYGARSAQNNTRQGPSNPRTTVARVAPVAQPVPAPSTTASSNGNARRTSTTSFVKKVPKRRFSNIKKYLYYTERCEFCIELIRILSKVPRLGNCVDCISIDEYDVQGISGVPAIDDQESEKPWELEDAFMWVIDQCNLIALEDDDLVRRKKMRPEDAVRKETIAKIEIDIRKVFAKVNGIKKQSLKPGAMVRVGTSENPMEKFRTLGAALELAPAVYGGVHSKEVYEKFKKQFEGKKLTNIESKLVDVEWGGV
jgi:hypothetical protein